MRVIDGRTYTGLNLLMVSHHDECADTSSERRMTSTSYDAEL